MIQGKGENCQKSPKLKFSFFCKQPPGCVFLIVKWPGTTLLSQGATLNLSQAMRIICY